MLPEAEAARAAPNLASSGAQPGLGELRRRLVQQGVLLCGARTRTRPVGFRVASPIPEPFTALLFASGLAAMAVGRRRRT